ncbi:MAG TPA: hypothetical protein VGW32_11030, partial [Pyrinomonadaceae bacterium]|nr:hypothetical protein [Pyrinomonadaceae bacterium]
MRRTNILLACLLFAGLLGGLLTYALSRHRHGISANDVHPTGQMPTDQWALYDRDPNHLWNRLYRALYQRHTNDGKQYGYDELDPLLWWQTKYLFSDPANSRAIAVLDEFLSQNGEGAIADPLKRAILQRDLWAVFDWLAQSQNGSAQKSALQNKLAEVIRRLALRPEEITKLPDFYQEAIKANAFPITYDSSKPSRPFLPADLFDQNGRWVMLSAGGGQPIARGHVAFASGRSVFLIFMRLPGGRAATLDYLKSVASFPKPWVADRNGPGGVMPNPNMPQFPAGTQLALVRKANVIDSDGNLRPTNIVEDIQIRVHRTIPKQIPDGVNLSDNPADTALDPFEFKLSRPKLFAGENGGLRAVPAGEEEFALLASHGIDFEQRETLRMCATCHFRPGVHSML